MRRALRSAGAIALLAFAGGFASAQQTQFKGTSSGTFANPDTGVTTGVGTSQFTWGTGVNGSAPSRFSFAPANFDITIDSGFIFGPRARSDREVFSLGRLTYFNGAIAGGSGANAVELRNRIDLSSPIAATGTVAVPLTMINTPNTSDPNASADFVNLPRNLPPTALLTSPGVGPVTIDPVGFGNVSGGGFTTTNQFHVLEGASASADLLGRFAPPCEPIVRGAVTVAASGATLSASFTPNFGLTQTKAAELCGYDHFNWLQTVTQAPHVPAGLSVPFIDPPIGGGPQFGGYADSLPYYWDESGPAAPGYLLSDNISGNTLSYQDTPADPLLTGSQSLRFNTNLVGVKAGGGYDVLYSFNWSSNYTGTAGGVSLHRNAAEADAGSGTGGVFGLALDVNPEDIPLDARQLMVAQGGQNIPLTDPPTTVPAPAGIVVGVIALAVLGVRRRFGRAAHDRSRLKPSRLARRWTRPMANHY